MENKKNKIIIMAVVVALMAIALNGCKQRDVPFTEKKFQTGTEGLKFEFLENAPPDTIYENNEFSIIMDMHNKGAYDINKGIASVSIEKDYLSLEDGENIKEFNLKGKSLAAPEGERKRIEFKAKTKNIGKMSEKHEVMVIGNVCYDYNTEATETVCIDPDIYNADVADKPCEMKSVTVGGTGAPITIQNIDVKMAQVNEDSIRPEFIINIENTGEGIPIKPDKIRDFCSDKKVIRGDLNKVYLTELEISGLRYSYDITNKENNKENSNNDFECFPNPVRLSDELGDESENKITCILKDGKMENKGTFSTELYVKLSYGYSYSKSKKMEIDKILR